MDIGWFDYVKKKREDPPAKPKAPMALWTAAISAAQAQNHIKGSEAIYAAVSRIANTVACMPLHLYKAYGIAHDDPREALVGYAPNNTLTPYNLKMAVEACRGTGGTAYILIVPKADGITPDRLDVLDPERVAVMRDVETREIWYQITLDSGQTATVHSMYVIALHHMTTDGIRGMSPLEVLGATLKYDKDVKDIVLKQLSGIQDSVVLNMPTQINNDRRDEYIQNFLDAYKKSSGHLIVLDGGVTHSTIKASVVDPKLLDVDKVTVGKVARVYNMPPRMLGDASASGYSTSEQDIKEYIAMTILPIITQWEEALNRKLLTPAEYRDGYRFRFSMEMLSRGDTATVAEANAKAVRSGWKKPNDVRREEYLPPDEYGDELMIARDTIPLRVVVENPELLLAGATKTGGDTA
jgi:HK97 family phage portal protein